MPRDKPYHLKEDDGRKTMVLIGILLILIIIAGAALISIISQKGNGQPPPIYPNETNATPPITNITNMTNLTNETAQCDDACMLALAVEAKNVSACSDIASQELEQDCYEQLSSVSLEACKAVADTAMRNSCLEAFALSQDDISLCDFMSGGNDDCRRAVDPCFDAADRTLCKALGASDPSICGKSEPCILNYSMQKKDESACSLIKDSVVSSACRSAVGHTDKCSSFMPGAQSDYCYELFAIYSGDYLTCTQISKNSIYMLDCLSHFSVVMGNLTLCDADDLGLNERWACYTNYSLGSGDIYGCQEIDELATTNRFRCAFEYAKKFGDPSSCQLIDASSSRSTCYEGAIIYSNQNLDWHNCADVTNFVWKNKCYTESAKLYADVSLCDKISETYAKESCINAYNSNQSVSD